MVEEVDFVFESRVSKEIVVKNLGYFGIMFVVDFFVVFFNVYSIIFF